MALILNDLDQATHLETEINDISSHANLLLWDPQNGIFRDRDWDGNYTDHESSTILLALARFIRKANNDLTSCSIIHAFMNNAS